MNNDNADPFLDLASKVITLLDKIPQPDTVSLRAGIARIIKDGMEKDLEEIVANAFETISTRAGSCTVCKGGNKAIADGMKCICGGAGTHAAEIEGLRGRFTFARDTFSKIMSYLKTVGYSIDKPQQILGAVEKLHQRAIDIEEEYVKLKRKTESA